jgi:hypothetical protein
MNLLFILCQIAQSQAILLKQQVSRGKGSGLTFAQFIDRKKVEGEVQFKDPKSGYSISADKAGNRGHGGSAWKLLNRAGDRVGSLTAEGKFLRK